MSRFSRSLHLLKRCRNMRQLKQAHAQIIVEGLGDDSFAISRIMAFCSDPISGSATYAHKLYEQVPLPTLCIRNTMLKTLLLKGEYIQLAQVYGQLLQDGLFPDNYALPYLLKACANLEDYRAGAAVHGHALQLGFDLDIYVGNTLILMYVACGHTDAAQQVFDMIPQRTAVSWTVLICGYSKQGEVEAARVLFEEAQVKDKGIWGSMISGYLQNNCFKEVLMMFRQMQMACVEPDEGILVSVLSACGQLGALVIGTWVHYYMKQNGIPLGVRICTALVGMYLKCGELGLALKLFANMLYRDVVCWNVMIYGLAMHGDALGVLKLFAQMKSEGFMPDETTFVAVLTACCHSGLIQEGLTLFNSMKPVYGIEPKGEHYACVVDFLGRAGLFTKAQEFIRAMTTSSSSSEQAVAWRALLSSCWKFGEVQLAEVAAEQLFRLEFHSGAYTLLSNVYGKAGKHRDSQRVKKLMKDRGISKIPGCSSVEISGSVHEFIAGERTHHRMEEVYELLDRMSDHLETM